MAKKRYIKTRASDEENKSYDENLRIRTITGSTPRDEDPDAPFSPPHMRIWEVLEYWDVNSEIGLDEKDVKRKRRHFGLNIVYPYLSLSFAGSIKTQLHTLMSLLFIAACILMYLFEKNIIFLLCGMVSVVLMIINAIIESNAASALEITKKYSSLKAVVMREKKMRVIDSRSLVPGDIIILERGNIVPADSRLIESNKLYISETPIYGQYGTVEKNSLYIAGRNDVGSMSNMVYAGSIITNGKATAVVCETGVNLQIRKIRSNVEKKKNHRPTLLEYAHYVSNRLSLISVILCFITIFFGTVRGFDIVDLFILSVGISFISLSDTVNTLASASLTIGIKEILDNGVALRNLNCIPELCNINSIMCEHSAAFPSREMVAMSAFTGMREYNIEPESKSRLQKLISYAMVCSDVKYAHSTNNKRMKESFVGNKADIAIAKAGIVFDISIDKINNSYFRIASAYNSRSELERVLILNETKHIVIVKGTPEFILHHCKYYEQFGELYPLDQKSKNRLLDAAYELSEKSQQIIAYAEKLTEVDSLTHPSAARDFVFVGFIGMYVNLELNAASAVYKCANAGIEAVVRSGDVFYSAVSLAKNAGIIRDEKQAVQGESINMTDRGIYIADLPEYKLFVRVEDEQWRDVLYYRKLDKKNVALQVHAIEELPIMSMADISIVADGEGSETLKQCADVITLKEGFDVISDLLIRARMVYKRINTTIQYGIVAFTAFCAAMLFSILAGLESAFRINELFFGGVVINFLILLCLAGAPENSSVLKQKLPKYEPKPKIIDFLTPILYGIGIGGCVISNFYIGKSFGGEYSSVLIGIILSLFLYAYSDICGESIFTSGGIKNYYLTFTLFLTAGLVGLLFYSPSTAMTFGYKSLNAIQLLLPSIYPIAQFILLHLIRFVVLTIKKRKSIKFNI
ncbi:MAG: hypothetical protein A2Y17_10795 [Clostridiales bacterium GWF2_38_85]|nr:MAG: hypothetical protein A2Y17_10795 [Clostridiales bacterium GWF2_38_85]HBL83517.1 hypothetical protein [Clostridiales bacterium]